MALLFLTKQTEHGDFSLAKEWGLGFCHESSLLAYSSRPSLDTMCSVGLQLGARIVCFFGRVGVLTHFYDF